MDQEFKQAFSAIRESHAQTEQNLKAHVDAIAGRLDGKLDLMNQQFNQHLIDDTEALTTLKLRQEDLARQVVEAENRRKEESERRLKKFESDQNRRDQWKVARIGGWFLIVSAVLGSLIASLMSYVEHRGDSREHRDHPVYEEKK